MRRDERVWYLYYARQALGPQASEHVVARLGERLRHRDPTGKRTRLVDAQRLAERDT